MCVCVSVRALAGLLCKFRNAEFDGETGQAGPPERSVRFSAGEIQTYAFVHTSSAFGCLQKENADASVSDSEDLTSLRCVFAGAETHRSAEPSQVVCPECV